MNDNECQAMNEWVAAHAEDEPILLADGFEDAFLGVAVRHSQPALAVYDVAKCIEVLMKRDGMDYEGAEEFLSFNTLGAWVGPMTPLFLWRYDKDET